MKWHGISVASGEIGLDASRSSSVAFSLRFIGENQRRSRRLDIQRMDARRSVRQYVRTPWRGETPLDGQRVDRTSPTWRLFAR